MKRKTPGRVPLDVRSLLGNVEILRFSGGVRHDPAVDVWLAAEPLELRSMARYWFQHMRQSGEDVLELIHDGCPVACVDDAPFAYVNAFSSHVSVGFFYGAMLADPVGLLTGTGKRMRHVKLRRNNQPDSNALQALIHAAYADIGIRLRGER